MAVDYNAISKIYDKVRSENKSILDLFIEEVKITNTTTILDAAREITPICCKDLHRPKLTASNLPRYEGESNCKKSEYYSYKR
ncbi:hypothetical protein M972_112020 [Acetivibrio thermocellus AD2]|jgi:hypothetical protein|uniref:Uncharacterized protein n=1 Tax=Acetivibrio thermocellus AD2 TaxID=1138384 RepID=A0AB36THH6_ACETH|nr:hypothetical protein AD2_01955 [Acetivibrio thermocellus AD2]ANV76695.1 hypothetical protein LQRI_1954 [Acetivibrio thermocellus DSM 2360]EIC05094.1 hypothetical protein YSBL_1252 [Acetivibrio thermocellus YS]THJ78046.1 hypothetical protein EPD62_07925 [Acetivibrio thermocellus]CDG34971.1 hypothetical protein CTHBC1_0299 [Acetivibrio thermocellus BC1]